MLIKEHIDENQDSDISVFSYKSIVENIIIHCLDFNMSCPMYKHLPDFSWFEINAGPF